MALQADSKILMNDKLFFLGMSPNLYHFGLWWKRLLPFILNPLDEIFEKTPCKVEYCCTVNDDDVNVDLNYNVNLSDDLLTFAVFVHSPDWQIGILLEKQKKNRQH